MNRAVLGRLLPHRPASLRGRVTLAVLLLVAVLLASLFVVVDVLLGQRLHADLRTRLTDRVALARQLDPSLGSQELVQQLRGDGVTAELCTYGQPCYVSDPTPGPPVGAEPGAAPGGRGPGTRPPGKPAVQRTGSTLYVRALLADGQQLTLSVDDTSVGSTLSRLAALESIGGLAALVVAGLLLGRVVGAALGPLDRMTALARGIAGGDRGRRLGTGRADTELGRTAVAFDAMLDELESALAAAHDAEATMRAFLSDASHELRTPLAGLQASAENLLRTDPDRAERERALAAVVRESVRAARLVDDLLTVSRGAAGLALRPEPLDLRTVAGAEVERFRLLRPELTWRLVGDAAVRADPVRLGQVLTNLLDNARHATPAGGTVTVTIRTVGAEVAVDVADTGPGLPAAERERVFDRLVRLDPSRARSSGGFGLGLPIARAIARAHGGDVVAQPGPGGRFRLTLPAAPNSARRVPGPLNGAAGSASYHETPTS